VSGSTKLLVVAGAFVLTYVAAAPYITAHRMKAAAEARDGGALSEHIEFPSVRQSLKDQMNAKVLGEMAKNDLDETPLATFGAALAGMVVDRMVDAYVTPAGVTQMMTGEKPNPVKAVDPSETPERRPFDDASMSYASLNKFVVAVPGEEGEVQFVLRRRGFGWMVTEILLPTAPAPGSGV
jgi:hypothetical protein